MQARSAIPFLAGEGQKMMTTWCVVVSLLPEGAKARSGLALKLYATDPRTTGSRRPKMMMTFISRGGEGRGDTSKESKATKSEGRGLEEGASRALLRQVGEEGCDGRDDSSRP